VTDHFWVVGETLCDSCVWNDENYPFGCIWNDDNYPLLRTTIMQKTYQDAKREQKEFVFLQVYTQHVFRSAVAAAVFVVFPYGGGRSRSMAARSAASEGASLHHARRSSSILVAILARQAVQKAQETSYSSIYHYSTWTISNTNHANIPTV
jgi:hypothetical protein